MLNRARRSRMFCWILEYFLTFSVCAEKSTSVRFIAICIAQNSSSKSSSGFFAGVLVVFLEIANRRSTWMIRNSRLFLLLARRRSAWTNWFQRGRRDIFMWRIGADGLWQRLLCRRDRKLFWLCVKKYTFFQWHFLLPRAQCPFSLRLSTICNFFLVLCLFEHRILQFSSISRDCRCTWRVLAWIDELWNEWFELEIDSRKTHLLL